MRLNRLLYVALLFFAGISLLLTIQLRLDTAPTYAIPDAERVTLLREMAYHDALIAMDSTTQLPEAWRLNLDELRHTYATNGGGGFCGNTALLLQGVYQAFGYESLTLNLGTVEHGHMLTVVRVDDAWLIQDAYFNITLTDRSGVPMDYFDALRLLAAHRHEEIIVEQSAITARRVLCTGACVHPMVDDFRGCTMLPNGWQECWSSFGRWSDYVSAYDWSILYDALPEGTPHDPRYLLMALAGVNGRDTAAFKARALDAGAVWVGN